MSTGVCYITTQGAILSAKTLQGKKLEITKFTAGDGYLTDDSVDAIKALTNLVSSKISFPVTNIVRDTNTRVKVQGTFRNIDIAEAFYLGRYNASGSSSAVTCKSGQFPFTNVSITNLRTYSRNIGTGWGQIDIWRWSMLQILYLVEYADYNSQNTLGYGVCNGSKVNSGQCDSLGMKSGTTNNDKKHAVIYRGVENIFGNIYQFIDGINITNSQPWISKNPIEYVSDKFASPYIKLSHSLPGDGYIKEVGYDSNFPEIQLPKTVGGSTSTYIPDYAYSASGSRVLMVGGYWGNDLDCGLWCANWNCTSSDTNTDVGGRLLFIPV